MGVNDKRLKKLRNLIEKEYSDGDWPLVYKNHILLVRKLSLNLGKKLSGNKEILEAASLLHDIGRIKYGDENHEIKSAEIAEEILKKLGFEEEFVSKVKLCIIEHRHSKDVVPFSLESKILRDADAISIVANPLWFIYLYVHYKGLDFKTSLLKLKEKIKELSSILILDESKRKFEKYYKEFEKICKNLTI